MYIAIRCLRRITTGKLHVKICALCLSAICAIQSLVLANVANATGPTETSGSQSTSIPSPAAIALPNGSEVAQDVNSPEFVPRSTSRVSLFSDVYVLGNPKGVALFFGGLYRRDYSLGPSLLTQGLYVLGGASAGVNPAYSQAKLFVESVPLAILQLRAQFDVYGFYGTNGALASFPSADARFGNQQLANVAASERSGIGYRGQLSPTLRAKLGRVILRNQTDISYYRLSNEPGYYLASEDDTLVKQSDWVLADRAAMLAVVAQGIGDEILLLGPAYEWTHAVGTGVTRQRAELLLFWVPNENWQGFSRPRVISMAGINLEDRNRKWQPFGLLGLGLDWDVASD